jgi:uncharacterized protein (DUF2461 family)
MLRSPRRRGISLAGEERLDLQPRGFELQSFQLGESLNL